MTDASPTTPLLEFRDAHFAASAYAGSATLHLDWQVMRRQLVLVRCDHRQRLSLLAGACCGMAHATRGDARFMNRPWHAVPMEEADAMRGMIGRDFAAGHWLDYLSVAENILIQQEYHTRRPTDELRREAARLASRFGLPGLPTVPPNELSDEDLRRAALVRAFLGTPQLIVLEQTARDTSGLGPALINAVIQAQQHATAVLWLAADAAPPDELTRMCDQQVRLRQTGEMEMLS